jgi:hypothetical protein
MMLCVLAGTWQNGMTKVDTRLVKINALSSTWLISRTPVRLVLLDIYHGICMFSEWSITLITDQETINQHLESIYGIKTGYHGTMISTFAKVRRK